MGELTELNALRAYARMMNTLDVDCLEPFLADDLRYNSQWVFEEMVGKERYIEYIRAKLKVIAESAGRPSAEIGELDEYPFGNCVIMAQDSPDNLIATVLVEIKDGKISRLDMCAVPAPEAARRTGEYPK
jgi:hypothetical protein